jgi:acetyltransferase-like isoleucine patch superfamily enzyme
MIHQHVDFNSMFSFAAMQCVILDGVVIRSDLCTRPPFLSAANLCLMLFGAGCDRIKLGRYCVLGEKCTVQPGAVAKSDGAAACAPLVVGSFVHIGSQCSISARAVGSYVLIGDGAVIGNGVDIRSCVVVTSGSVVQEAATLPSHTGEASALASGDAA